VIIFNKFLGKERKGKERKGKERKGTGIKKWKIIIFLYIKDFLRFWLLY